MIEFNLNITASHYVNLSNIVLCFPVTFRKKPANTTAIDGDLIPVNKFFAHWKKMLLLGDMAMTFPFCQ